MLYKSLDNFITEALNLPSHAIDYTVGKQLAELFPQKAVVQTQHYLFDLEEYAKDKQCRLEPGNYSYNEFCVVWQGEGNKLQENLLKGWYRVNWRNFGLEVLTMNWGVGNFHWILADIKEIAETFLASVCDWNQEVHSDNEVLVFESGGWEKDEDLLKAIKGATFENLVLEKDLGRDILADLQRFFNSKEIYDTYSLPWKRGVLLVGPPGNGKTHAVKALINSLGKACIYVKSFQDDSGDDETNMRIVFDRARKIAPCVLVLEDLDSQLTPKNRSFFLNELDGFASNNGILTLATTNYPEKLDPAITQRPSRFDRKYHFELPGLATRENYLKLWNTRLQPELRLGQSGVTEVAALTEGFSFAYLKELFVSSMMAWIDRQPDQTMDGLMAAQAASLREQMTSQSTTKDAAPDPEDE